MEYITIRYTGTRTNSMAYTVAGRVTRNVPVGQNAFHRQLVVDQYDWAYIQKAYPLEFLRVPDGFPEDVPVSEDIKLIDGLTDKQRDQLIEANFETTGQVLSVDDPEFQKQFKAILAKLRKRIGLPSPDEIEADAEVLAGEPAEEEAQETDTEEADPDVVE